MSELVVILAGDDSPEREISLWSAKAVQVAAQAGGYNTKLIDPLIDGLKDLDSLPKNTVVLPILHGLGGEDGKIQQELENRHLPFLGTGSIASDMAFNKWKTKQTLISHNIPVPKGWLVNRAQYAEHNQTQKPHVLKAVRNGSSIGVLIVRDPNFIRPDKIDEVFSFGPKALLEELIQGIEITVPILDQKALPVIEIIPPGGGEFDFKNKYNGQSKELCPPLNLTAYRQKKAQKLALTAHRALNCKHLSRVDIMIDNSGQMFVLEVNTMPGMTDVSLFPKSAAVAGINFVELVKKFVKLAIKENRYNKTNE